MRHAIVVIGAGTGSGCARSTTARPSGAGCTFQQPATGSQRYSSSVRPARRSSSCVNVKSSVSTVSRATTASEVMRPASRTRVARFRRPAAGSGAGDEGGTMKALLIVLAVVVVLVVLALVIAARRRAHDRRLRYRFGPEYDRVMNEADGE